MSIFPVHQLTRFAISLYSSSDTHVQRSATVGALGLVNFSTAFAYHFCPGRRKATLRFALADIPHSSNGSGWTREGQSARQVSNFQFAKGR